MSGKFKPVVDARYRWMVVSRLAAGTLGGYAVASLLGAWLAFVLPAWFGITLADGVVIGTMLGFVVHAGLFVLAFSPLRAGRVWGLLAAAGAVLAVLLWGVAGNVAGNAAFALALQGMLSPAAAA